jgi:hypothetical protein
MARIDFAKGDEQHRENEPRLHKLHHGNGFGFVDCAERQRHPTEIEDNAEHNGEGEYPRTEETQ